MHFQTTKTASLLSVIALSVLGTTALSGEASARPYAGYSEGPSWSQQGGEAWGVTGSEWGGYDQQWQGTVRHARKRYVKSRRHHREHYAEYSGRTHRKHYALRHQRVVEQQNYQSFDAGYARSTPDDRYADYNYAPVEQQVERPHRRPRGRIVASRTSSAPVPAEYGSGAGSSLVSEARRYIGGNPTGRSSLWCGAFMDLILRRTGHPGGGNLARSYASYGTRVSGPQVGSIAVMSRRGGGHVGVVSGVDASGNPIIISGNHGHRVAEAVYPRGRIYAYVMP